MPEVTHQEEESEHELCCSQPLTKVHVVHRVWLGDDAANGVQRSVGGVRHVLSCTAHLPWLNVILQFVEAQTVGATEGLQPRTTEVPETHGFATEDDFTGW